ncbi:MAG: hypothetical protein IPH23_02535 [Gammaproteobacteria bacterium]|nr:hypothetical protein [Gammaproteobacteria bacterium]
MKEIGDGSQDRVLRWDRIRQADHDTYKNVDGLVTPVPASRSRVVTDADWRYLLDAEIAEQNRASRNCG